MTARAYFLLIDTETTTDGLVADFGAMVLDRKGTVYASCGILLRGVYTDRASHPLYHSTETGESIWCMNRLNARYDAYERMIESGARMVASVNAVNNWLAKAATRYQPILTAYNLAFDRKHCANTGIDLTLFSRQFCLMKAAQTAYAKSRAYKRFVLARHKFRPVTSFGNMCYRTDAETMAEFCTEKALEPEPHTALEDCTFYEAPILNRLTRTKSVKWLLLDHAGVDWRDLQVRDNFKPC